MVFLVVYIEINCLCLRNWRKWGFVCGRRTSMKSGSCVMILRRFSGIFVTSWFKSWARSELWEVLNRNAAQMLSLSEIWNVNTVWTYRFSRWFSCFLASVLSCVFTVRYQLSFWSTQFPRKAAFIFKVYQSVHSVCYAWRHVPGFYCNLYFMLSELSRPSLRYILLLIWWFKRLSSPSAVIRQLEERVSSWLATNFLLKTCMTSFLAPLPR